MISRRIVLPLLVPGVVAMVAAHGQQRRELVMSVENVTGSHQGRARVTGTDSVPVIPHDTVRYRLAFTNIHPDSLRNVKFDDPVPAGMQYIGGSARADRNDVTIEFSLDNGKSYSTAPTIEVTENGLKVRRAAPPSSYTNVRWSVRGWVKANGTVSAELMAVVGR